MLLPIGDTPNPRRTPLFTYLLLAANVGVYLFISLPLSLAPPDLADPLLLEYLRAVGARGRIPAEAVLQQVSAYDLFVFRYGFRPAEASLPTLFSSMFLHGGALHLAGNMLFLWIFGDNIEARLGRFWYLLVYLGTGVAATAFFAIFVPGSEVPMIGASGAISGVLGCYFFWFPRNQVRVFVFLFPFLITPLMIPARIVLGFYLVVDNLLPFLFDSGGGGGVAHGAHIGGFLAGAAVAFAVDRFPAFGRPVERRGSGRPQPHRLGMAERIGAFLRQGEPARATQVYINQPEGPEKQEVATADLLRIADYLFAQGDRRQALSTFRRIIAERPADTLLDQAYLGAGKALLQAPRNLSGAADYFLAALDVTTDPDLAEEARRHLRAIDRLRLQADANSAG